MARLQLLGTQAYPRTGEPVHLRLVDGTEQLLVDCGPGIVRTFDQLGRPLTSVTDLFVTHSHADHTLGVPYFLLGHHLTRIGALADDPGEVRPLTIRGEESALEAVETVLDAVTPGFNALLGEADCEVSATAPGDEFAVGDVAVTVLPADHTVPTQGLLFDGERRVVYTSDTTRSSALVEAVGSADVVIHESMYLESEAELARELGHGTAREAGRFASDVDADELYLVHLADQYGNEKGSQFIDEASKAFSESVSIPEQFDRLGL
jgi:ribonuclease BN (tRNA processing enzyme)